MSAVGTFRTWGHVRHESIIGTKADVRGRSEFMGSRPSQSRLSIGYERQNDCEDRDKRSRNGGECAVVIFEKVHDLPEKRDHRSPWILLGFLLAFILAPLSLE
jgi:hypothetical protein